MLFNPAFLALLLFQATRGYEEEAGRGQPLPLAYLGTSVALHRPIRELLPRAVSTNLLTWLQRNQVVRAVVPAQATGLSPLLREGALFALASGLLRVDDAGDLRAANVSRPRLHGATAEIEDCQRRAIFMGRWLSRSGSAATVLALFGIRP